MPDAALSVASSPLAAVLAGAHADSGAKPNSGAQASDPFAALLAGAAGGKPAPGPGSSKAADAVAALLAAKPPVILPATAAAAAAAAAANSAGTDLSPAAEVVPIDSDPPAAAAKGKGDDADDKDADDTDDGADRLGDAIASGATAVLALSPPLVTPVQTQIPIPALIKIDAPVALEPLKLGPVANMPLHSRPKTSDAVETMARADQAGTRDLPGSAPTIAAAPRVTTPEASPSAARADRPTTQDQIDSDTAQADARAARQQASVTQAQTAAPQLPSETARPLAAEPGQGDDAFPTATMVPSDATATAAPTATTVPAAAAAAAAAAKVQPQQQSEQAAARQEQQQAEALPSTAETARRRSDDVPAPRRASDPRKRSDPTPADAISAGPASRVADSTHVTASPAADGVQAKGDAVIQQTLAIARDGAWLDRLAHDIASAGNGGDLQFKLDPQNLGALSVAIRQSADGASIRMTADNEKTRDILVDAQPKLIAEAHAQGLKVSDTQVDLRQDQNRSQNQSPGQDGQRSAQNGAGQNGASQNGQNRQSSPDHQPFVSNLGRKAEADPESPERDSDVLYA